MAFGKTLISPKIPESGPAGSELFARAMQILPDMTHLCRDSVEATEIFCCIALYLQSIDHRSAAYVYVSATDMLWSEEMSLTLDRSDKL
jgi:hypothetical protein